MLFFSFIDLISYLLEKSCSNSLSSEKKKIRNAAKNDALYFETEMRAAETWGAAGADSWESRMWNVRVSGHCKAFKKSWNLHLPLRILGPISGFKHSTITNMTIDMDLSLFHAFKVHVAFFPSSVTQSQAVEASKGLTAINAPSSIDKWFITGLDKRLICLLIDPPL